MGEAAHAQSHGSDGHGGDHHHIHPPSYYVKIWAILLVLLIISIVGPMLGHKLLTLVTAFGIAVVKATLVAGFFMHLSIERKYIWYLLFSMLLALVLFYWGVATDINRLEGRNWVKTWALQHIEHEKKAHEAGASHGGEGHNP